MSGDDLMGSEQSKSFVENTTTLLTHKSKWTPIQAVLKLFSFFGSLFDGPPLIERLQCDDEDIIVDTLRELQNVASESLFFEPEIVESLFLRQQDFILATFEKIGNSSPPSAVITTLARITLFPHIRIAFNSLGALFGIVQRPTQAFAVLPSPIFPSSSPHQQYSGLPFLAALPKKLRIVFSEFQNMIPTDPSHLPKFIQLTKDDRFLVSRSVYFCSISLRVIVLLLKAGPPIKVDSNVLRELILFVKEALPTILTNISTLDILIASLPSDSTPTTPYVSVDDTQVVDSLQQLRDICEDFVSDGWNFFADVTFTITDPLKLSFQSIIFDNPSFPDLILNSLKLNHEGTRKNTFVTMTNVIIDFEWMKTQFMSANLVGRMFETVDFVSLPLSESNTLFELTRFLANMFLPIGHDEEAEFEQYSLIRVSVFEPAKGFIKCMFRNSDKLILNEEDQTLLESVLCLIHNLINNMELRSDEHDASFVSEMVKWEQRTMVEMENEAAFTFSFENMLNRTKEWRHGKPERQKRREVLLREEGWDDSFELRVVGIEVDTNDPMKICATFFRIDQTFNADEF
ncbi:hypothetical protein BLNAU_22050 [Blattamonas nauphoetae]|uniref:Uncharacterized protein n=1 Tax=Blattamonas nauphoetae TaxID=2049346 RepID=A0ABQ9WU64_9EUKA|nr:hypothetical protein BLNAU_22050 [Blattamonas nauphoetae]